MDIYQTFTLLTPNLPSSFKLYTLTNTPRFNPTRLNNTHGQQKVIFKFPSVRVRDPQLKTMFPQDLRSQSQSSGGPILKADHPFISKQTHNICQWHSVSTEYCILPRPTPLVFLDPPSPSSPPTASVPSAISGPGENIDNSPPEMIAPSVPITRQSKKLRHSAAASAHQPSTSVKH